MMARLGAGLKGIDEEEQVHGSSIGMAENNPHGCRGRGREPWGSAVLPIHNARRL